jgi:N-methylhydantoinase A
MDPDIFNRNFETLERMVDEELEGDGIKEGDRVFNYAIDIRYGAQYYTLRMPIDRRKYDGAGIEGLCAQFDRLYESLYGKGSEYTLLSGRIVTAFMVDGIGKIPNPVLSKHTLKDRSPAQALKGQRKAFFRDYNEYRPTDIYDYARLEAGNVLSGPAIVEAVQTTTVIPPGREATIDEYLNIVIR